MTDPTVHDAVLNSWEATAYCKVCGYGRPLDLLALQVAGRGSQRFSRVFPKLRCHRERDGKPCGEPASGLIISRQVVGKREDVRRYER
jgi:hypothetical protein